MCSIVKFTSEDCFKIKFIPKKDYVIKKDRYNIYLEPTPRSGKWLIFVSPRNVDEVWEKIKKAVEEGKLGDEAKVSVGKRKSHVICVYTYDWTDFYNSSSVQKSLF